MKKTYLTPAFITADHRPASLCTISDVNSNIGIGGGGGAGNSVIQRTRQYDNWASPNWSSFDEE